MANPYKDQVPTDARDCTVVGAAGALERRRRRIPVVGTNAIADAVMTRVNQISSHQSDPFRQLLHWL
jgi:hypothetical protein